VRSLGLGGALLILAACDSGGLGARAGVAAVDQTATADAQTSRGTGKIIDTVGAIKADQLNSLSQELAEINQVGGPQVTVVLVRPTSGESMEQLGWALAGRPTGKAVVLLTNPDTAMVRVEGALDPERKAQIAAAMQQQMRLRRPVYAIQEAINILRGAA
jgi:hypothetical protein